MIGDILGSDLKATSFFVVPPLQMELQKWLKTFLSKLRMPFTAIPKCKSCFNFKFKLLSSTTTKTIAKIKKSQICGI